jgi:hypothetical protein
MDIDDREGNPSLHVKNDKLTVAWWNTSLAPKGISRKCSTLREHARDVISYLISSNRVDFIALGETSEEDLEHLKTYEALDGYTFISGTHSAAKSKFDTCYIYNPERLTVSDPTNLTSIKGTKNLRIAQRLQLCVNDCRSTFEIFVSHWPSRLWCDRNHADRDVLGIRLRDAVDRIIRESTAEPHIILLGDYNDEPFSDSLSEQLMASRDIELVKIRPHLLYNPYWNLLGNGRCGSQLHGGSYYYNKGTHTRWHTFDQIIYSHAFIKAKAWRIAADSSHLAKVPGLNELVISNKSKIDHIPVIGTIERVPKP